MLFVFAAFSLPAQSPDDSTFSLSPGDITEAKIHTSGPARLEVTLTPEKREELSTFTGRNVNKQVKIVVGGKVRSEPFIRERIAGPSMEILVSSYEDALATVKTLLTSRVAFEKLHKWTDSDGRTHYSEKPPPPPSDPRPPAEPVAEDNNAFKELQGSWAVVKATTNGKENRDPSLLGGNWTFKGNELALQSRQEGKARFTLKMDPKAEPKAFHLTPVEPANEASGWMLFSREGERLKIAFYDNLKGRPESFEARGPRSERELIVVILSPKK
ncbi:MAG TPA: TIGR03067 domain-containing protein [Verrucomicrobiae bacterium]|nr:TIGR03067 domain-containing protein [Verrucomicrobiae bacterium]